MPQNYVISSSSPLDDNIKMEFMEVGYEKVGYFCGSGYGPVLALVKTVINTQIS
jgi:hypothetical protein